MRNAGFDLFDSPIGTCALAWTEHGIATVQLPEGSRDATVERLRQRSRVDARVLSRTRSDPAIRAIVDRIGRLFEGQRDDLADVPLDLGDCSAFRQAVYAAVRAIPPGETRSYGAIAAQVGDPRAARAIGQAMGANPVPILVPCHRVLAASGRTGGFSASGGVDTKLKMLALESGQRPLGAVAGVPSAQASLLGEGPAFAFDPDAAVRHLRSVDPRLGRWIDEAGPFRMELQATSSLFGTLCEAIVHQQLSTRVAQTIHRRVLALFGRARGGPTPAALLRLDIATLRGAGLSQAKALALRDLAEHAVVGAVPTLVEAQQLDDEALVERLVRIRGIGRWTAQMVLMFRLGRGDVLPVDDLGIRNGFAALYGSTARADLLAAGARWSPYATVASWYLWRAAERAAGAP